MKILGINGSGRPDGNTAVLVNAVLNGAAEAGAETSLLQLAHMTIAGCKSCNLCKAEHRCVLNDDMTRFYDLAPETDVLVLGSPIYFDQITGQMKTFFDRLYCYLGLHGETHYPRRDVRAVLAVTYEAHNPSMYDYVLDWMENRLKGYYRITTVGRFKTHGTRFDPIITAQHPDLRRACEFGRTLKAPAS